MSGYPSGDVFMQLFSCCAVPPSRQRPRPRSRIDRTMIGLPTNFQHTVHIGSGDVQLGSSHLTHLQTQMQSKGGYDKSTSSTPLRAY